MILASYIRPFDAKQKIYVLDKNKKDTEEIRLTDIGSFANTVVQLLSEYYITELELHGREDFCSHLKEEVLNEEMTKYNNNQLKITLKGV